MVIERRMVAAEALKVEAADVADYPVFLHLNGSGCGSNLAVESLAARSNCGGGG